jgi:hypothetical protein
MGRTIAVGALLLTSCLVSGAADARRARCGNLEEVTAVQTAAVQQELMVAALTCHEIDRFNAFQTGYGPELRVSDARLASLFRRLYGARRGEAAYHTFKTKLANDSEMRSIHNNPAYCQEAGAMLSTALGSERPRLAAFVRNLNVTIQAQPVQSCQMDTAAAGEPRVVRRHRHRRLVAAQ